MPTIWKLKQQDSPWRNFSNTKLWQTKLISPQHWAKVNREIIPDSQNWLLTYWCPTRARVRLEGPVGMGTGTLEASFGGLPLPLGRTTATGAGTGANTNGSGSASAISFLTLSNSSWHLLSPYPWIIIKIFFTWSRRDIAVSPLCSPVLMAAFITMEFYQATKNVPLLSWFGKQKKTTHLGT
jgi:hypothetical protein